MLHICYTFVTYLLYSLSPSCHHRFILFCFTCCGTRATHVYGILPSKWTYATAALFTSACYKNPCYLPSDHRQTLVTNLWTPLCSLQVISSIFVTCICSQNCNTNFRPNHSCNLETTVISKCIRYCTLTFTSDLICVSMFRLIIEIKPECLFPEFSVHGVLVSISTPSFHPDHSQPPPSPVPTILV